jgi:hypothetical protein
MSVSLPLAIPADATHGFLMLTDTFCTDAIVSWVGENADGTIDIELHATREAAEQELADHRRALADAVARGDMSEAEDADWIAEAWRDADGTLYFRDLGGPYAGESATWTVADIKAQRGMA